MSVSNLIDSNRNLGNQSQSFCSKSFPPNILSRLIVGIVIKDVARIYDIAVHIIIGLGKIAICTTKILYSIPAKLCGSTLNYDIGKEGFAHLGFSGYYFADMFISLTNTINGYPKDKMEKVENLFSEFLGLKKNAVSKEEKPQIKEALHDESLFSQEYAKYSVKHSSKFAKKLAKISVENHPRLFNILHAEYVKNNKNLKKNIQRKATEYAKNCVRIYSPMYSKFLKECSKEQAKEQALLYAKTYVNAYSKELNRKVEEQLLLSVNVDSKELKKQLKIQLKKKFEKQADTYANYFTKLFFSEYQHCLENTSETAEKYIEIFYKACIFPDEISEEKANKIKDFLFKDFLREIPKMIKKEIDLEHYFKLYTQKYVECCLKEGLTKNTKTIAARYAESLSQPLTIKMIKKFNKTMTQHILNKRQTQLKANSSLKQKS